MPESQNTEWKSKWKDEYLEWICGYANAQGGKIYIGCDDEGLQAAREIFSRHSFFERLLIDAGVDEGQAHEDACSLEHAISRQSFAVLKDRLEGLAAQKAAD